MNIVSFKSFLLENFDNWERISAQLGSNPGGLYKNSAGKHYVKFYENPEQAKVEHASNQIHKLMGVNTPKTHLVHLGTKLGVASEWNDKLKNADLNNVNEKHAHQLARMYHAAILTRNHDIVGLGKDNILKDDKDNLHSIDQGGSFHFRARGGHKEYGTHIGDRESLLDKSRPAGEVFSNAFEKYPHVLKANVRHLENLQGVEKILKNSGIENYKHIANNFHQRQAKLLKHYEGL